MIKHRTEEVVGVFQHFGSVLLDLLCVEKVVEQLPEFLESCIVRSEKEVP